MIEVTDIADLEVLISKSAGVVILWGGKDCGVCHSIKPKVEEIVLTRFPKLKLIYIDCHKGVDICAQKGVFTLPTLQVYFEGQLFVEEVRAFSLQKLEKTIERPYAMVFDD